MTKSDSKYEAPSAVRLSDSPLGQGACSPAGSGANSDCNAYGDVAASCDTTGSGAHGTCNAQGSSAHACSVSGGSPIDSCTSGGGHH
jgi:hypothetical protein